MRAGIVVASGRSEELAAVTPLAGLPLVRHVADRLEGVVNTLVVGCRDDQRDDVGVALARYGRTYFLAVDSEPERAPLSGLHAGLRTVARETDADYAFAVSVDRPFLDPRFVDHLFERAMGFDAAVPCGEDGPDPLAAVYHVGAALDTFEEALTRGNDLPVALSRLDHVTVAPADLCEAGAAESLERVDSPAALAAAERRLENE